MTRLWAIVVLFELAATRLVHPPASPIASPPGVKDKLPNLVQIAANWDPGATVTIQQWQGSVAKGSFLACLLDATDTNAGKAWFGVASSVASEWKGTLEAELDTWGWIEAPFDQHFHCNFANDGREKAHHIGTALVALGIDPKPHAEGGHNICYNVEHGDEFLLDEDDEEVEMYEQLYYVGEKEYHYTGGYYRFAINQNDGVIMVAGLLNPFEAAKNEWDDDPTMDMMPALRRASDIVSAYWLRGNQNPRNLRYYFANHIKNDYTLALIAKIFAAIGRTEMPYWPGVKFTMDTQEAESLLGSPIGATLAYLLLQHKAELGIKHVTEVIVFREAGPADEITPIVQMLFRIEDVPDLKNAEEGGSKDDLRARDVEGDFMGRSNNILRVHRFFT
ncbi:hypothetical protein ACN47E_009033 [Coniothyrium glycines]